MRMGKVVVALTILLLMLGVVPAAAKDVSLGASTQTTYSPNINGGQVRHPKMLQTAYYVAERIAATDFQVRYTLTRNAGQQEGPEMHAKGKLSGQVLVYRDGTAVFQSTIKQQGLRLSDGKNGRRSKGAVVSWDGIELLPGDIVLFTAEMKSVQKLWRSGYSSDGATISGEIYDNSFVEP